MPDLPPGVRRRLSRSLNRIKTRGPREVFALAAQRVRESISSRDTLILLFRDTALVATERDDVTFRKASADDAAMYATDVGSDSASTFAGRLSDDVMCFVVEADGRIVHASWVTTSAAWTREIGGYLAPPEGDAYVYESFTRADARGRGIYPHALAGIVTWLHQKGVAKVWVGVEEDNEPSRRAIAKGGFSPAFELSYSRRWGRLHLEPPTGPMAETAAVFLRYNEGR